MTDISMEEKLIRGIREGDERSFAALVWPHRIALVKFAAGKLGCHSHLAEDAVQEAMLNAYRAIRDGKRPENMRAWLFTIVHNCAINIHRGRQPSAQLVDLEPQALLDTSTIVEQREWMNWLMDAITELPDRQRNVLVGHALEGYSYNDLARRYEMTVPAVKTLIHRARQNLRYAPGLRALASPVVAIAAHLAGVVSRRAASAKALLMPLSQTLGAATLASGVLITIPGSTPGPTIASTIHRPATGRTSAPTLLPSADPRSAALLMGRARTGGESVIRSCESGHLTRTRYSRADLRYAVGHLDETVREYSNCPEQVERALRDSTLSQSAGSREAEGPVDAWRSLG